MIKDSEPLWHRGALERAPEDALCTGVQNRRVGGGDHAPPRVAAKAFSRKNQRMCLAIPARVIECNGDEAVVDLQGSNLKVSRVLTPEAGIGDWVLVHAGFAITQLDEDEARETWDYLREGLVDPRQAADAPPTKPTDAGGSA